MSSVYRVLDYPWDTGYILNEELRVKHAMVLFPFRLNADIFIPFFGCFSRVYQVYGKNRPGKSCFCDHVLFLLAFAAVEAARPQFRETGWMKRSKPRGSFWVVMFI